MISQSQATFWCASTAEQLYRCRESSIFRQILSLPQALQLQHELKDMPCTAVQMHSNSLADLWRTIQATICSREIPGLQTHVTRFCMCRHDIMMIMQRLDLLTSAYTQDTLLRN